MALNKLFKRAAADWCRQIGFLSDMGWLRFRLRPAIERRIISEDAEGEALRPFAFDAVSGCPRYAIWFEPPREQANRRNSVASDAALAVDSADINAVCESVERAIGAGERRAVAQVGQTSAVHADMPDRLGPAEQGIKFHRARRPVGHRAAELFEQRQRALAPPE